MVVPFGDAGLLPRPAEHRHRAARAPADGADRSRRLLRAATRACGRSSRSGTRASSPSCTRAARPTPRARISTRRTTWRRHARASRARRRLAEPLPAGARVPSSATPFRAVALTQQLPRMLQGTAPALAINQLDQFGIRGGQASATVAASFESQFAGAADRVLNGTGREAFDAIKMLKSTDPAAYQPDQRRRLPAHRVRPGAAADRAALEGRRRTRGRVRRRRRLGHARQPGRRPGPARHPARRLRPRHRRARHRPRRPHGRHGRADDVGVRARGGRERQSRHRPRPRQRDDRRSAAASAAAASTASGRASRPSSATRAATSRSPPTSATSSARSSCGTSASAIRARSFRATR